MQTSAPTVGSTAVFLLLSPLPNWKGPEESIADGLAIRRLSPPELMALIPSHTLLDHQGVPAPARQSYWVCYQFENPHPPDNVRYRRRCEAALKLMLHALYAIQILAPVGGGNLLLLYRETEAGLALESMQQRQAFIETVWARLCGAPPGFRAEIPALLERVREVFQKPILRLQIPIWLLEQGMAAPDRHIRILLWTTGIDGVTGGGGTVAFAERLCDLLGADTPVFPADAVNRMPRYRVADVAEDLYQLRNEMAHGLPFHEKFRKTRGFVLEGHESAPEDFASYRYDRVLEECALFLLCATLRAVLLQDRASS